RFQSRPEACCRRSVLCAAPWGPDRRSVSQQGREPHDTSPYELLVSVSREDSRLSPAILISAIRSGIAPRFLFFDNSIVLLCKCAQVWAARPLWTGIHSVLQIWPRVRQRA